MFPFPFLLSYFLSFNPSSLTISCPSFLSFFFLFLSFLPFFRLFLTLFILFVNLSFPFYSFSYFPSVQFHAAMSTSGYLSTFYCCFPSCDLRPVTFFTSVYWKLNKPRKKKQFPRSLLHPSLLFPVLLFPSRRRTWLLGGCNHFTTVFVRGKWTKYLDAHKQSRIIERVICGSWLRVYGLVSA